MPLDEGLGPRQFKLRFNLHGMILEGKLIYLDKIKELTRNFMVWTQIVS